MRDEVAVAGAAARAAGAVVLNYYGGDYAVRDKGAIDTPAGLVDNPVTSADLEADALLREMLLAPYPDYGWLSEETADSPERLERSTIWIVDPIDGTKEFLEQIPEFVVSIALVEEGVPVVAAMYNPALDDLYIANRDGGCFLNGKRVFCTAADLLAEAALIVSRSETRRGEIEPFMPHLGEVRAVGSVAYKLALVAAGQADLNASVQDKNEWDVCAGDLLVREAGGEMLELSGRRRRYNQPDPRVYGGLVAGNPSLTRAMLELILDSPS